ncbi:MAG: dephospho-CoA kinase [bacterium]|nr:dephospho-CoA kinase [bacterium]MDT8365713.1 dephospho-CoA kinase [bacterium]
MPVIAITGGIGSGKSTVRQMFEEMGAFGIDADELARQVVTPGSEGARLLEEEFGSEFFDSEGRLRRRQMAQKVFDDPQARSTLEAILHPLIRAAEKELVDRICRQNAEAVVVVEIPLLAEGGRSRDYSGVVLVTAPDQVRISRLVDSGRYSSDEAVSRMASQAGHAARENIATWIVNNAGERDLTAGQVRKIYKAITGK